MMLKMKVDEQMIHSQHKLFFNFARN